MSARLLHRVGVKVVLTGEGWDKILAGYPFFRRDMLQHDAGTDAATTAQRLAALGQANRIYGGFAGTAGLTLPLDGVARTLGFVPSILAIPTATEHPAQLLRRSHGNGAFDRKPHPVPRSPSRRGGGGDAGEHEAVVEVLDSLPGIEDRENRDRVFPMLLALTSSCILQERYHL
jgi:hypothetical protein